MEKIEPKITKNTIIAILCVIVGMLLAYVVFSYVSGRSMGSAISEEDSTTHVSDATPTEQPVITNSDFVSSVDLNKPDEMIFTATKLGFNFSYLKFGYSFDENGPGVDRTLLVNPPKGEGNKIIFGQDYSSSLTLYAKRSDQSLESAIREQFLVGIPQTKCIPKRIYTTDEDATYTPTSRMSFVRLKAIQPGGCPTGFDTGNLSAAFFIFSDQPTKFFYVVGTPDGTLPLTTVNGTSFIETIRFMN